MTITLHHGDIPADLDFGASVAVDTETMGLKPVRDRLCVVQLSAATARRTSCNSRLTITPRPT